MLFGITVKLTKDDTITPILGISYYITNICNPECHVLRAVSSQMVNTAR